MSKYFLLAFLTEIGGMWLIYWLDDVYKLGEVEEFACSMLRSTRKFYYSVPTGPWTRRGSLAFTTCFRSWRISFEYCEGKSTDKDKADWPTRTWSISINGVAVSTRGSMFRVIKHCYQLIIHCSLSFVNGCYNMMPKPPDLQPMY